MRQGLGHGRGIGRRDQVSAYAIFDKLRDSRYLRRQAGKSLTLSLHQHVRQAITVSVPGYAAGQHKQVGAQPGQGFR